MDENGVEYENEEELICVVDDGSVILKMWEMLFGFVKEEL